VAPAHVKIVDSADSTAHAVHHALQQKPQYDPNPQETRSLPRLKFFATDSVEKFRRLGAMFLGHATNDVEHVDLKE
jgi:glutamate racemase